MYIIGLFGSKKKYLRKMISGFIKFDFFNNGVILISKIIKYKCVNDKCLIFFYFDVFI